MMRSPFKVLPLVWSPLRRGAAQKTLVLLPKQHIVLTKEKGMHNLHPREQRLEGKQKIDGELTRARTRMVSLRAKQSELILAKQREEVILKSLIEAQAAYIFIGLRQAILNFPTAYARRILNVSDPVKAKAVLTEVAHNLLNELKRFPEKVVDKNWLATLEEKEEV
jgi:hypothetical protein